MLGGSTTRESPDFSQGECQNGGRVYSGEWTWMWQYSLLGTWNWKLQGIWSLSFLVLILGLWKAKRMMLFDRVYDFLHDGRARDRKSGLL